MGTVVQPHVNQFASLPHGTERRFAHGFGLAHEGDDGAVGGLARIDIQQTDACCGLDFVRNGANHLLVSSLTEVGDTLNDTLVCVHG